MSPKKWFRTIIGRKKKENKSKQHEKVESSAETLDESNSTPVEAPMINRAVPTRLIEDIAAIRIQNAFRSFMARRTITINHLRGTEKFEALIQDHLAREQTATALSYIHSWCGIQDQIRTRRLCMVTEARIKHKKLENQLKLEAKLHELEFVSCGFVINRDKYSLQLRHQYGYNQDQTFAQIVKTQISCQDIVLELKLRSKKPLMGEATPSLPTHRSDELCYLSRNDALFGEQVEWNCGSETMEEILSRIHQREEAAVKRERAMAYAFSHQWRPNCSQYFGQASFSLGKESWGWSWMDRWVAARPWEVRIRIQTPKAKKANGQNQTKSDKVTTTADQTDSSTPVMANGNETGKAKENTTGLSN